MLVRMQITDSVVDEMKKFELGPDDIWRLAALVVVGMDDNNLKMVYPILGRAVLVTTGEIPRYGHTDEWEEAYSLANLQALIDSDDSMIYVDNLYYQPGLIEADGEYVDIDLGVAIKVDENNDVLDWSIARGRLMLEISWIPGFPPSSESLELHTMGLHYGAGTGSWEPLMDTLEMFADMAKEDKKNEISNS